MNDDELKEWQTGAKNRKLGLSLTQSSKHIDRYNHDLRKAHKEGWTFMDQYLICKVIDENVSVNVFYKGVSMS
jgi:hypothetical protein